MNNENRPSRLMTIFLTFSCTVILIVTGIIFQEDCQGQLKGQFSKSDQVVNKEITIPFPAVVKNIGEVFELVDSILTKYGKDGALTPAAITNAENYSGKGGCHCVSTLTYEGREPVFEKTEATGNLTPLLRAVSDTTLEHIIEVFVHPKETTYEVRVNAPDGDLFMRSPMTQNKLDAWAVPGTKLYLQDVTGGKPLVEANTINVLKIIK